VLGHHVLKAYGCVDINIHCLLSIIFVTRKILEDKIKMDVREIGSDDENWVKLSVGHLQYLTFRFC
jgi:hypothetical protein